MWNDRLDAKLRKLQKEGYSFAEIGERMGITRNACLLYTSDAADDLPCVDLGGRRNIKKKKTITQRLETYNQTTLRHALIDPRPQDVHTHTK